MIFDIIVNIQLNSFYDYYFDKIYFKIFVLTASVHKLNIKTII